MVLLVHSFPDCEQEVFLLPVARENQPASFHAGKDTRLSRSLEHETNGIGAQTLGPSSNQFSPQGGVGLTSCRQECRIYVSTA